MGEYGDIIHLFLEEIMDRIKLMGAKCTFLLNKRIGWCLKPITIASKSSTVRQVTFTVNSRALLISNSGPNLTELVM